MVSGVLENPPRLKYPKSVAFIISNEFCERFNYYGLRAILVLYLTRKLGYDNDEATVWFHVFSSMVYFFPLIGAIIADSWLGRFKTILYLSIVYVSGNLVITLGAIPTLNLPAKLVTIFGLLLIAIGTGGIKPCVSAFGGDQFKLPEQAKFLATFFSLFYLSINIGSLISTTLTPILREDVHCFGETSCYSLAFGVPGVLMVLSVVIFVIGKPFYKIKEPSGNMLLSVSKCIVHAIKTRSKERLTKPRYHWLDYAEQKFGKQLVSDVKALLKILVLYIPLPIFWALFDQQSSRWTFQATQMDGHVYNDFTIKPDQMQVLNPFIVVFCIPLFTFVIYPALEKINIKTHLQKMVLGMALCGIAFVMSGLLELKLQQTYAKMPRLGEAQLRIFNGQSCNYRLITDVRNKTEIDLPSNGMWSELNIPIGDGRNETNIGYELKLHDDRSGCELKTPKGSLIISSGKAKSFFLTSIGDLVAYPDSPKRSNSSLPLIRLLMTSDYADSSINLTATNGLSRTDVVFENTNPKNPYRNKFATDMNKNYEIESGIYFLWINGSRVGAVEFQQGGVYTIIVNQLGPNHYTMQAHIITEPNKIHILWQVPQYIVITAGEIMFSVTGLEFSYSQAPTSMKSVLQALWLLTVTFGNIIVAIIAELRIFESQAAEFFLFAALMAVDICIFIWMAIKYKYRNLSDSNDVSETNVSVATINVTGSSGNPMNETFTLSNGLGPTEAAIAAGNNPRSSLSNNGEELDESPKCLKQRNSNGKSGVDNYGYADI